MMAKIVFTYKTKKVENNYDDLRNFILANADAMASEINTIMANNQYKHAVQIGHDAVAQWYGAYGPMAYGRTGSLYNVVDPQVLGEDFSFNLDSGKMGWHHQDNEYVYGVTFKSGLHGGPVWRTPIPLYTEPLGPAPYTISPYDLISSKWYDYLGGEYFAEQKAAISKVAGKYAAMFR